MSDFLHESKIREMTNELFDENGYPDIKEYTEGQIRDAFNSGYAVGQEQGAEIEVVKALEEVRAEIEDYNVLRNFVGTSEAFKLGVTKGLDLSAEIINRKIKEIKHDKRRIRGVGTRNARTRSKANKTSSRANKKRL